MNLIILLFINCVFGANILYIAPVRSHSHHIWNRVLAFGLCKKGHNVTMLTHDNEKTKPNNFHLILLEGIYDNEPDMFTLTNLKDMSTFSAIKGLYEYSKFVCKHDFETKGLASLMNYPKDYTFDLVIFDVTVLQCLYPLIERFHNPPVVAVTIYLLPPILSNVFGNPLHTSFVPAYNTLYNDRMSFTERLFNNIFIYFEVLYRKYIALPEEYALAKDFFGNHIKPLEEMERNISILLANTDPNLEYPASLPPNIIPVGGLQIQPAKPLPKDLQKIVDNAKNGIIVFSLGTYYRSDKLSLPKREAILNALAKLTQTVIWKFETELKDLPKNVIVKKWLPQSDLLAHPNVKLLINHGGALSSQEAMYHGIPLVVIPFYGDQYSNAARLQYKNMAEIVDYHGMTAESFYKTISDVLNNPKYRNNIKSLSERYRDRQHTPLEKAIFWVEYVLRHGTAEHLNLAARDMSFFQSSSLDIYVTLLAGLYMIYTLIGIIFTCLKAILKYITK